MEFVDLDFVLDGLVAEVIGRAVADPQLDDAAGEPGGEAESVAGRTIV